MAEEGSRGNISAAADARAHHIIETADSMVADGKLSMVEMTTFLKGSRHEGWLEWLLKDKYHAGGHWDYHEHFRQADEDHNSTLDYDEIVASVQQWLDAGSPGLSAPRKPEPPKRAELTDKERELLAFRVAGAPEVVPPPPPRKKASIYEKPHPHAATAQSSMMRTGFSNSAWDGGEAKGLRSRGRAPLRRHRQHGGEPARARQIDRRQPAGESGLVW
jgi:hypothetical protein